MDHSKMGHEAHRAAPSGNPAVQAYTAANDRMHTDMAVEFTGDADADFMRGMIPHHQGAIDMAFVVLEQALGKSAFICSPRKLDGAEALTDAQPHS